MGSGRVLGLIDRIQAFLDASPPPTPEDVTHAFWSSCHGGQRRAAELLLDHGADINWKADWDGCTPLDARAVKVRTIWWHGSTIGARGRPQNCRSWSSVSYGAESGEVGAGAHAAGSSTSPARSRILSMNIHSSCSGS